ncbi:MAG: M15 family metallopeptidase [Propioniciclava sp.]|uniref:M15 family metallopeptidase n=1 Tax=Propioniciclava sp. TaxID=2038686 RepID=UPI0039E40DB2
MTSRPPAVFACALIGALLLSACSGPASAEPAVSPAASGSIAVPAPTSEPAPTASAQAEPSTEPAPPSVPASASASASRPATPEAIAPADPPTRRGTASVSDDRTGKALDTPFTVDGVVVVSKKHRVSAGYVPPWASQPHGLHPDAYAAFQTMAAAAKKDGAPISIRSGYRSFADQKASFAKAMKQYDEATARRYYAEAGASEHQTGLALDAWDGRNRGTAFARTKQATWLAAHAHEYGFIVRYPQGKTDITGYAWESWHLRWVGKEISSTFGPNSSLTLEEYLGLA